MSLIKERLEADVDAWAKVGHPALIERFVLRHGEVMKPIAYRDSLYPQGQCFMNATHYVDLHKHAEYVEGYAIRPSVGITVLHAWAKTKSGNAVDPTWNDSLQCEYMGIVIDRTAHRKIMRKTGVYGVLDHGRGVNTDFIFSVDPGLREIVETIRGARKMA